MALLCFSTLILLAATPYSNAIALPDPSVRSLSKRGITIDPRCNEHAGVVEGIKEAQDMANRVISVLNGDMKGQWTNARNAIFGDETITSKAHLLDIYGKIAKIDGTDVAVWCGEPPKAPNPWICEQPENKGDGENKGLAAYRFHVDPNDKDTYPDDTAVGYADGNNLVVCNFAIRRYAPLKTYDPKPAPGQPFEQYKWTYGSMFVHEFSHIFGTLDSSVYEYGYTASTQLVSDTIAGKSKDKSVTPGMFADSYSFLALAVSEITSPALADFDWSGGNAITVA